MTIGDRIKKRRLELGYSQEELAKLMGYKSKAAISKKENSKDNLNTATVERFAKALHCPVSYLMGFSKSNLDPKDASVISYVTKNFLSLNEEHRKQILDQIDYLLFLQSKNS